jgi:Xaa-Pro aminopeptidase
VVGAEPLPWQQEIHDVVRQAQQAGIRAAVPGASARDVDNAARSVIASAGFGDAFTHGTGHGVGLQIHEPPMLTQGSVDNISAGSPITIEPGIYLPGRGGVRIEDTIVVGDPARVFTEAPRDLIVVG